MKLMDKLKNALFEEEYVEVEEKPKHRQKREAKKEKTKQKIEKPIAKKIAVPEKAPRQEKLLDEDEQVLEETIEEVLPKQPEFRFPVMEEEDFSITQPFDILDEKEEKPVAVRVEQQPEKPLYQASKAKSDYTTYDYDEYVKKDTPGVYEKKTEHTGFKPSPIISPIYGVLDKNYTKEEVKEKREVRISTFSREDLDLDAVRRKAYGSLESDIEDTSSKEVAAEETEPFEEENLLVDLSSEDTPTVNKVTVGDAEEYFEDLGLEYNKDYIDASKEKATGRRIKEEKSVEVQKEEPHLEEENKKEKTPIDDNDNLFDLIDSMYSDE